MKEQRPQNFKVLRILLRYLRQKETVSSAEEKDSLWERIQEEAALLRRMRRRRVLYLVSGSAAAAIALLLVVGTLYSGKFRSREGDDWLEQYVALLEDSFRAATDEGTIQLRLSDGRKVQVRPNGTVAYTSQNTVAVGKDTIRYDNAAGKGIDQIITPAGKQACLTLKDGTRMWVNAGTHVVYPHEFKKDYREIFVDGEVYLEVARNEKAPFFVKTKSFSVQVLGTKFNVSSYPSASSSSVVLVEGSVKVAGKSETVLTPSQLVRIEDGALSAPVRVDVEKYISWTDNLLIYEDEPLDEVLKKLGRYYGKRFVRRGNTKDDIRISGKLELNEDLDKVLRALSYSFPVEFEKDTDCIRVMTREK